MKRLALAFSFTALSLFAQWRDRPDVRRAEIRGGGDHGKCTIEVVVDDVAEVAIRGDSAQLRTLSGQRAEWRRFVCNQVMPMNPAEFRFTGIDGRGRQILVREPGRGGPAVIRLEDPKGGREGYTFDVEWRGDAGGNYGGGGYGGGRDWGRDNGRVPWTGRMGGEFSYRGDGRGMLDRRSGQDIPVRDVVVSLSRDGRVVLEFEARGSRRLLFAGQARRVTPNVVEADLASTGGDGDTRGFTQIYMDNSGQVDRVSMKGRINGDPFTLEWSAR